ncbi:MAG: hypothetical protein H0X36_13105 [Sphingomonadaceae bacterium]|nr:hypothetical protein [Sphingomonadaceae bacterium]
MDFRARQIVNAEAALLDDSIKLVDARFARVVYFARTSRTKAAGHHREDERKKAGRECVVECTIYGDIAGAARARHAQPCRSAK